MTADTGCPEDLLPLPDGVSIPALAFWTMQATTPGSAAAAHLEALAAAARSVCGDMLGVSADKFDPAAFVTHADELRQALAAVTNDIGPLKVRITAEQTSELAASVYRLITQQCERT
ncbi:hypothetical protein AB0F17_35095 [Nonomuraea sp. NPDC026600]|uniref:hypothetical protein n=1 Tax=Nonomuraea sp. NPDC026600 TaxID=3155363 RepID=UPI0033FC7BCE